MGIYLVFYEVDLKLSYLQSWYSSHMPSMLIIYPALAFLFCVNSCMFIEQSITQITKMIMNHKNLKTRSLSILKGPWAFLAWWESLSLHFLNLIKFVKHWVSWTSYINPLDTTNSSRMIQGQALKATPERTPNVLTLCPKPKKNV